MSCSPWTASPPQASFHMSSAILARKSSVSLDPLLGPWLIGLILSSIVFGVTCLQVYLYYTKFSSRDPLFLKLFVGALWTLDAFHLALLSMGFYANAITNFGDFTEVGNATWAMALQIFVGTLVEALVQMFYAWRIWTFSSKSPYIPAVITTLALAQIACSIEYAIIALRIRSLSAIIVAVQPFAISALSCEVAADLLIAGSMIYLLSRNRSVFRKTTKALNTLIAYSISSGFLVMVVAVCCFVTLFASRSTLVLGIFLVLTKLYGCSFMSILNSREHVREQLFASNIDHAMLTIPSYHPTIPQDRDRTENEGHLAELVFDGRAKKGASSEAA
ncbi:hypothetical protein C8J57DRAFT_1287518 [Mycena rebaudengoi]|nr:hypothetical protein C8J57DRAFT_1287518 [Mycena rebaudengoi]